MSKIILIVSLFFILITLSYFFLFHSLDPDFGWHLKTGELILERGVHKVDWYSFTMPDFPWIDNSWLTDVLIYKIYSIFGFQILLLFFLAVAASSFVISIKTENFWFHLLPIGIGFLAILGFLGVRPQLVTVLFIAILWKILIEFLDGQKLSGQLIYSIPFLFIIWANLHGGFFVGIFVLFLILFLEIFKKTDLFKNFISRRFFPGQNFQEQSFKKVLILSVILILSFLFTILNPYGLRIHKEVLQVTNDSFLRFHIVEWLPLFFKSPFPVFIILYITLFFGLLLPLRKKIEFNKLILAGVFFIFSLLSQRHFVIFVILTIPIFAEIISLFLKELKVERVKILFSGYRKWLVLISLSGILFYGFYSAFGKEDSSLSYPQAALPFLKTLPLSENLFNEYGWGGYLIWKLPERKVFIDGRMPSWRKDDRFVFGDYVKIMKAEEGFDELLDKYEIKIVLLRNDKKEDAQLNNKAKTENRLSNFLKRQNWLLKALGISLAKDLKEELVNSGWQTIYEDETVIILRR